MPFSSGSTLHIQVRREWYHHLWIIITDPDEDGNVLMVNVTTLKPGSCDATTILEAGDHPYIRHKSLVNYAEARICKVSDLESAVNLNIAYADVNADSSLVEQIQKGFLVSDFSKRKYKNYIRSALGLD